VVTGWIRATPRARTARPRIPDLRPAQRHTEHAAPDRARVPHHRTTRHHRRRDDRLRPVDLPRRTRQIRQRQPRHRLQRDQRRPHPILTRHRNRDRTRPHGQIARQRVTDHPPRGHLNQMPLAPPRQEIQLRRACPAARNRSCAIRCRNTAARAKSSQTTDTRTTTHHHSTPTTKRPTRPHRDNPTRRSAVATGPPGGRVGEFGAPSVRR
jgi:hypothetical protein